MEFAEGSKVDTGSYVFWAAASTCATCIESGMQAAVTVVSNSSSFSPITYGKYMLSNDDRRAGSIDWLTSYFSRRNRDHFAARGDQPES